MIDEHTVEEYGTRLGRLCFSLCKNHADARDLYQDTWLKAIKCYKSYREDKPFEVWLYSVCVSCFYDMCRKKEPKYIFDTLEHEEAFFASVPDMSSEEKADYSRLYEAIKTLTPKQRCAVSLFYFDDHTVQDAAAMMKMSPGAFKTTLSRAREKLRKVMK